MITYRSNRTYCAVYLKSNYGMCGELVLCAVCGVAKRTQHTHIHIRTRSDDVCMDQSVACDMKFIDITVYKKISPVKNRLHGYVKKGAKKEREKRTRCSKWNESRMIRKKT